MKRLAVFALILTAPLVWSLLTALSGVGARESFSKVSTITVAASTNRLWVPSFAAATFRPSKLTINHTPLAAGTAPTLTVTIYRPYTAGPNTATDSLAMVLTADDNTGVLFDYYGPTSDTMRVVTAAGMVADLYGFGR